MIQLCYSPESPKDGALWKTRRKQNIVNHLFFGTHVRFILSLMAATRFKHIVTSLSVS